MSTSLVRKSLETLDYEKDSKQVKRRRNEKSKGTLDLIPANHRIINKRGKKDHSVVLSRSSKITVEEAKQRLNAKIDPTETNIQRLLVLSGNRIDPDTADKLLNRALNKRYVPKEETSLVPEETAFTEADFKKFEKEYFVQ